MAAAGRGPGPRTRDAGEGRTGAAPASGTPPSRVGEESGEGPFPFLNFRLAGKTIWVTLFLGYSDWERRELVSEGPFVPETAVLSGPVSAGEPEGGRQTLVPQALGLSQPYRPVGSLLRVPPA